MKKWSKLLIAVLLVVCVISPIFTTASCEINDMYDPSGVDNTYLGESIEDNWLLKLLAKFVYTVADWAENVVGNLLATVTGTVDFPWADKIVFNSVAVLDVNFINPAQKSYMAIASEFIQKIYWTMFTIALSLFGVLVLITAIKLAISTIASDKAKYKQALTSWVLGFVMLWTIHFLMAFLFYLNEQLVIEASRMATSGLEVANARLTAEQLEALKNAQNQVTSDFESYITNETIKYADYRAFLKKYEDAYLYLYLDTETRGTEEIGLRQFLKVSGSYNESVLLKENNIENLTAILQYIESLSQAEREACIEDLDSCLEYAFYVQKKGFWDNGIFQRAELTNLIKMPTQQPIINIIDGMNRKIITYGDEITIYNYCFAEGMLQKYTLNSWRYSNPSNSNFHVRYPVYVSSDDHGYELINYGSLAATDILVIPSLYGDLGGEIESKEDQKLYFDKYPNSFEAFPAYFAAVSSDISKGIQEVSPTCVLLELRDIFKIVNDANIEVEEKVSYITNLARYFKKYAYKREVSVDGSIKKDVPEITNQIMYAILVVQSIMLFIAYIKRLFFALLLSMMAPLVVVVDFFQKFGK